MIHKLCIYIACWAGSPSLNFTVDKAIAEEKVLENTCFGTLA